MAFVLTVIVIVSPVKYTDLSVLSDRERYDGWKTTLLGVNSSPDKVAFVMIGIASISGEFEATAWHGVTVAPTANNPKTRIVNQVPETTPILALHLSTFRLF